MTTTRSPVLLILGNGHMQTAKFLDYQDWIHNAADKAGFTAITATNLDFLAGNIGEAPLCTGEEKMPAIDAVLFADKDLPLARAFEASGIPVFNNSQAVGVCDHKGQMHERLAASGLPTPDTVFAPFLYQKPKEMDLRFLDAVIHRLGLPIVVKEAYGSFGEQVHLAQSREELEALTLSLAGKPFLFQAFIKESRGEDLRLNVIGGEVIAAMRRTSETDFRANVTAGGKTAPHEPTEAERALAIAASRAVCADFAGVDLLRTNDGPVICEVNTNPHIRSIHEATGIDIAPHMMAWIDKKIRQSVQVEGGPR
ncbi:ATP-grasp domain-containing protein [Salisediminibacterium selenitireducens]|uniref:Alpha-L-glutamate ligase, RimK family n=1 Tax=Bacillus selenitireducens (strain ATCC 700615 / DSM 15326 / MLS10) TaxID=439292 RepID=D6XT10_BACIE|nr:RimK family alpha-L-glutamate ligase [Salisediminibacterium selenitireducens]ADH98946.1 alpha-L-glutamate ligase, RimK family [[Bacillus] selenitireducens MLS10]